MKRLLILGCGQYGKVAKEIAEAMNIYDEILFLDDKCPTASGKFKDISTIEHSEAIAAVGNPELRSLLFKSISKPATLIHPKAVVMPSVKIGEGSILCTAPICANSTKTAFMVDKIKF